MNTKFIKRMTADEVNARRAANEFKNAPTHRVNVIDAAGVERMSAPAWGLDMAETIAADRAASFPSCKVEIETTAAGVEQNTAHADEIAAAIEATAPRSAWAKGVKNYAVDLLDWYTSEAPEKPLTLEAVLNGAEDWGRYSWGAFGVGLVGNCLIAEALCNATELKKTKGGTLPPNSREQWPDVQARALFQAWEMITRTAATLNTAAR